MKIKNTPYYLCGSALLVGVVYFFSCLSVTTYHSDTPIQSTATPKLDKAENIRKDSITISSDASYPSPVIQLQQSVAHGLIQADNPPLLLLKGELSNFSQENITDTQDAPDEIRDLKSRLLKLKSISDITPELK